VRFDYLLKNAELLALMVGVSLLSAFAQFWIKLKKGEARFSFAEVIGESVVCMSAGITCGLLLMDHVSTPVMLGAVSVAAHMGTRFIYARSTTRSPGRSSAASATAIAVTEAPPARIAADGEGIFLIGPGRIDPTEDHAMTRKKAKAIRTAPRAVARAPLPNPSPRVYKRGVVLSPQMHAKVKRGIKAYQEGRYRRFETAEEATAWVFGDE
jgi:hypothetical protein